MDAPQTSRSPHQAPEEQVPGLRVLLVDNYDSFVYNLVQYLGELGIETETVRNDEASASELVGRRPDFFVISPGPSDPDHAGVSVPLVTAAAGAGIPLLGVCLGHQCIAAAFGGRIQRVAPMHGKVSQISHDGGGVFADLPNPLQATRYHSLAVDPQSVSEELRVTARSDDGIIMGLEHRSAPLTGVQFHPESVLTDCGRGLLARFARFAKANQ